MSAPAGGTGTGARSGPGGPAPTATRAGPARDGSGANRAPYGSRFSRISLLALALLLALPSRPAAHEVPADVTVLAFVAPAGDRLRLLVRAPLEAMRDMELPLRGSDYLDVAALDSELRDAARLWIAGYVTLYEAGRPLGAGEIVATRVSRPSDRSFRAYDDALAHVTGGSLDPGVELPWRQALLDVLIEYPITDDDARFSIEPEWAHLGLETRTVLRFRPPDGAERAFRYEGDPGVVRLDPRWHQAALRFVYAGFRHILEGLDHLLFLLCLVIPVQRLRPLVAIVTSFTVAHSITLLASALGLAPDALWFPPLIETLIAVSIVYMALENIVGAAADGTRAERQRAGTGAGRDAAGRDAASRTGIARGAAERVGAGYLDRRWLLAFGFGLVHGFGFSFALSRDLQFAGAHLFSSLLAFNVGVELGQLTVLAVMIPALIALYRWMAARRLGAILLSALVAHEAWHWMTVRGGELLQYDVRWPALDVALIAAGMRWLMLLLIVVGAAWALYELFARTVWKGRDVDVRPAMER